MADFADRPLVGPGSELQLTIDGRAVPHGEVVAGAEILDAELVIAPAAKSHHEAGEMPGRPDDRASAERREGERLPQVARTFPG